MHEDMGSNMIADLKGLRAKVSKKNVILSRRKHQDARLQKHYANKGVHTSVKNVAKYLGLGTTLGVRRTLITIKERINRAKPRNRNVSWMNKINKKARATYGMEGVGYSPDVVRALRTMAADSMGCSKRGRCPITAIAVAKNMEWDPYGRGPGMVMKQWADAYPCIEPKGLKHAWDKMVDQLDDVNITIKLFHVEKRG